MSMLRSSAKKIVLVLSALGLMLAFTGCSASDSKKAKAPQEDQTASVVIGKTGKGAITTLIRNKTGKAIKEVSIRQSGEDEFSKLDFSKGSEFMNEKLAELNIPAKYKKDAKDAVEKDGDPNAAKVNERHLIDLSLSFSEDEKHEVNQLPIETLETLEKSELRFDAESDLVYFAGEAKKGEKFNTLESQKALKAAAEKAQADKEAAEKATAQKEAAEKAAAEQAAAEKEAAQKNSQQSRTQKHNQPAPKQKSQPRNTKPKSSNVNQDSNPCAGEGDPGWR
ncbi:hypothetical protein [Varibaculum cambriense]|uniref:hypothetical protein n=1 Tax=Varibaculum cambriense TaxID=184870 RepID=UPI0012E33608|nr:hypothetical protein [Varibaculum cambriense]